MAGFSVPVVPFARRPAIASSPSSQMLHITPASAQGRAAAATKKRQRNIACVLCNKQKKKCGLVRPCPRCVELKVPCTQPVKPEGYCYFTKKRKLDDDPPAFPGSLWTAVGRLQPCENQPQHLPSPSPTISTVGTPQPSYTSISSYDDSALIDTPAGKTGDTRELDSPNSHIRPRSVSPGCASVLISTGEPSPKLPPIRDMSRWDLLPPPEELPDEVVKDSRFATAPIFGLESPVYEPQIDLAAFGEPMDLGEDYAGAVDDLGMQEIDEILGINAGVATSGVAPGAGGGIAWDPDWLDHIDLSNTDLVLDDVDLSDFDLPSLDNDILTDLQPSHLLAQIVPRQSLPAPPPPPP